MVNRDMSFALVACLLLFATSLYATPDFSSTVFSKEVQYGKSITLTLSASGATPVLTTIDLHELHKLFHINTTADVDFDEETGTQHWKLRLSPYKKGRLTIPSFYFNQTRSNPIELTVTNAIDTKTGTPIKLLTNLSTQRPWMREQVLLRYHLQTHIPHAQLKVAATKVINTIIQPLDIHHQHIEQDQQSPHHYKTGWAIFPLKVGQMKVTLPPVELIRDGITTHRFYHPPIELEVQALPLYIPSTIPVGVIELENQKRTRNLLQNSLADYKLSLIGHNMLLGNLPEISNQISSTSSIRIYPESRQTIQTNTDEGVTSRINYNFPIKVLDQGQTNLNDIKLTYFDTLSGTLKTHFYSNLSIIALNKWLAWLIMIIVVVFIAYTALRIVQWFSNVYKKLSLYLLAIKQLRSSCTPEELKVSMSFISYAEGKNANITVDSWFETIASKIIKTDGLRDEICRLLYKERLANVPQTIREGILNIAFTNMPVLRLFNRIKLIR